MNLPTPFGPVARLPPVYAQVLKLMGYVKEKKGLLVERNVKEVDKFVEEVVVEELKPDEKENEMKHYENTHPDTTESESELESDKEEQDLASRKVMPQPVRRKLKVKNAINKRPRLALLKQTCVSHTRITGPSTVGEVFETSDSQGIKRLQLNLQGTVLPQAEPEATDVDSSFQPGDGFGKMESTADSNKKTSNDDSMVEWQRDVSKFISKEELQTNMVNKAGKRLCPIFCLRILWRPKYNV